MIVPKIRILHADRILCLSKLHEGVVYKLQQKRYLCKSIVVYRTLYKKYTCSL